MFERKRILAQRILNITIIGKFKVRKHTQIREIKTKRKLCCYKALLETSVKTRYQPAQCPIRLLDGVKEWPRWSH